MQKQITLNAGSMARLEKNEPFVLPDTLEIEFNSTVYRLNTLAITAKNGDATEKFKLTQKPYKIELKDVLKAGRVELEISSLVLGEVVKSWRVPDIIIKEVEHTFEAIPEIEELKNEINTLKKAIADILKLI